MKSYSFGFLMVMFITLSPVIGSAQKIVNDLKTYMQKVRTSKYESFPKNLLETDKNEKEVMIALTPYLNDTVESVKEKAYFILKHVGLKSKEESVRQDAVTLLSQGIHDKNTAVSGNCTAALCSFSRNDFTDVAKDSIVNALTNATPHLDQVVKLTGYLGLRNALGKLNEFSTSSTGSLRWASIVARARMNDRDAIDYILRKLNTTSVNDGFVYDIVPDLIYTRQKDIFLFLGQIIRSNKPSCESANPDSSEKILCAYRLMEFMAPVVAGVPLKVDADGGLSEVDYKKGLEKLRDWLNQNPDYQLLDNTF